MLLRLRRAPQHLHLCRGGIQSALPIREDWIIRGWGRTIHRHPQWDLALGHRQGHGSRRDLMKAWERFVLSACCRLGQLRGLRFGRLQLKVGPARLPLKLLRKALLGVCRRKLKEKCKGTSTNLRLVRKFSYELKAGRRSMRFQPVEPISLTQWALRQVGLRLLEQVVPGAQDGS